MLLAGGVYGQSRSNSHYLVQLHLLLDQDKPSEALKYADSALVYAKYSNKFDDLMTAYLALYEVHSRMNDYQKAISDFRMASVYRDSSRTIKMNAQIDSLKSRIVMEQEARQLEVKNLNEEIARMNEAAEKVWLNMVPILAGLVILAGLAVFMVYRERRRLQATLWQSEEDIRQLSAFKDKLYTVLSYDLRTSLSAFENLTHGLSVRLNDLDKDEAAQFLSKLHETAGELKSTINNVILWVALQANSRPFVPMNFDCKILAAQVLEKYRVQLNARQLAAEVFMPEGQEVYADREMVEIILENLLTNAIHFTPAHGAITLFSGSKDGLVTLGVKDTGVGISPEDIDKLFKAEADIRSIGKSTNKGAGVGLILIKQLVERNGGRMYVESTAGEGSTFYCTLPEKKFA